MAKSVFRESDVYKESSLMGQLNVLVCKVDNFFVW